LCLSIWSGEKNHSQHQVTQGVWIWHISKEVLQFGMITAITMLFVARSRALAPKKCKGLQAGVEGVSAIYAMGIHHSWNTSNTVQLMD